MNLTLKAQSILLAAASLCAAATTAGATNSIAQKADPTTHRKSKIAIATKYPFLHVNEIGPGYQLTLPKDDKPRHDIHGKYTDLGATKDIKQAIVHRHLGSQDLRGTHYLVIENSKGIEVWYANSNHSLLFNVPAAIEKGSGEVWPNKKTTLGQPLFKKANAYELKNELIKNYSLVGVGIANPYSVILGMVADVLQIESTPPKPIELSPWSSGVMLQVKSKPNENVQVDTEASRNITPIAVEFPSPDVNLSIWKRPSGGSDASSEAKVVLSIGGQNVEVPVIFPKPAF